jgi:hypothetical protein
LPEWLPDLDQEWFRGTFAMDEIFTDLLHRDRRRPDPDLQRLC